MAATGKTAIIHAALNELLDDLVLDPARRVA